MGIPLAGHIHAPLRLADGGQAGPPTPPRSLIGSETALSATMEGATGLPPIVPRRGLPLLDTGTVAEAPEGVP